MTNLKMVLMKKGMSGKKLAELAGVSRSTVHKYMSNNRSLSEKVAGKFASILGVAPAELLGLVDPT